ncbi:MAG: NAD-dependent epimerase/dehydratase family protein [candidate division NC10 bacterium]|nr:NAD-dependent epimerase/dehydratase family protein [candidate division NC10 bacterium]
MSGMRVAVTGASGYLGRTVVTPLESDPTVQSILGLDIRPPAYACGKLEFRAADLCTADLERHFQGLDAIYHLAFVVQPSRRMAMAQVDAINIQGSRRVFDQAIAAGVGRIIHASSVTVYGVHPDNPSVPTEESPRRPNPGWYYSRAKGQVEDYLDKLERRHPSLVVIRLRPAVLLGPLINNPVGSGLRQRRLISFLPGTRSNYCWDEDAAEAFRLALSYDRSDCFNLAGDGALSVREHARRLGWPGAGC